MLIEGDGADEGDVDMAVRREKSDQRQQAAQEQGDPTLDVEQKNPTHTEPSPLSLQYTCTGRQGGEGALAATSASCRNQNLGRLQPRTLKPAEPSRPEDLNPTIRPLAGNNLGSQPSAGAASGAPEGEAQGIPKKLAVLAGAGGRQIGRANAIALAAKGNAGEDYGAGGVIRIGGNPHPGCAGRGLVAQPVGEGGDPGDGVEALQQFGSGQGSLHGFTVKRSPGSDAPGARTSGAKRVWRQLSTSPGARQASGPRREPPAMAALTPSWL